MSEKPEATRNVTAATERLRSSVTTQSCVSMPWMAMTSRNNNAAIVISSVRFFRKYKANELIHSS